MEYVILAPRSTTIHRNEMLNNKSIKLTQIECEKGETEAEEIETK